MMRTRFSWLVGFGAALAVGSLAAVAAACGDDDGGDEIGALTLRASDFAFQLEGELRPGPAAIVMPNEGQFEHYALFFRIEGDHSADEVVEALSTVEEEGAEWPEWAVWKGGPSILSPGETAELRVNFEAGRYVYMCPLGEDDPDGISHIEKGMIGEITIEGDHYTGAMPAADIVVRGEDDSGAGETYAFGGVPASVEAGEAWLEFENAGSEPHEMVVARTPAEFSLDETLEIFFEEADPPENFEYVALGGPAPILPGDRQQLRIDFQPDSRYVLLCFLQNAEGTPHVALGMAGEITVPPP